MAIFSGNSRTPTDTEPQQPPRRRRTDAMPLSVIGQDLTVAGDLDTDGMVKVEGRIRGNVRAGGEILIAPGAVIEGDLSAREVVVGGEVHGRIQANERVELQPTALVVGDIVTQRIAILEGGRVSGEVKVEAPHAAAHATPVPETSPQSS